MVFYCQISAILKLGRMILFFTMASITVRTFLFLYMSWRICFAILQFA